MNTQTAVNSVEPHLVEEPKSFEFVAVIFPNITQLDLTGPLQVFAAAPGAHITIAAENLSPVIADSGFVITPTATFESAPQADLLFVPGGPGAFELLSNELALRFIEDQAKGAAWITSVCTGAFPLASTGLLDGYRATTHWASKGLLARYGVDVAAGRVVFDRNRVTGGGVTSGIDFALSIVGRIWGDELAQQIQLQLEYDPHPPYNGTPEAFDPRIIEAKIAEYERRRLPLIEKSLTSSAHRRAEMK